MAFQLKITNFRNIKDLTISNSDPITFITGENESGKSSVGGALEFIFTNGALGVKGVDNRLLVRDGTSEGMAVELEMDGLNLKRTLSSGTSQKNIARMLGTEPKVLPLMFPQGLDVSKGSASIRAYLNTLQETAYDFNGLTTILPEYRPFLNEAMATGVPRTFKALIEHAEGVRATKRYNGLVLAPEQDRPTLETIQQAQEKYDAQTENLEILRQQVGACQRAIASLEADLKKAVPVAGDAPVKPAREAPSQEDIQALRSRLDELNVEEQTLRGQINHSEGQLQTLSSEIARQLQAAHETKSRRGVDLIAEVGEAPVEPRQGQPDPLVLAQNLSAVQLQLTNKIKEEVALKSLQAEEHLLAEVGEAPVEPRQGQPDPLVLAQNLSAVQLQLTNKIKEEVALKSLQAEEHLLAEVRQHLEALTKHQTVLAEHAAASQDPLRESRIALQSLQTLSDTDLRFLAVTLKETGLNEAMKDASTLEALLSRLPEHQKEAAAKLTNHPLPGQTPLEPIASAEVTRYLQRDLGGKHLPVRQRELNEAIQTQLDRVEKASFAWQTAVAVESAAQTITTAWDIYHQKQETYQAGQRHQRDIAKRNEMHQAIGQANQELLAVSEAKNRVFTTLTEANALCGAWATYEVAIQAYQRSLGENQIRDSTQGQLEVERKNETVLLAQVETKTALLDNARLTLDHLTVARSLWAAHDAGQIEIKAKTDEAKLEWNRWDGWIKKLEAEEREHRSGAAGLFEETLNKFAHNTLNGRKVEIGETEFTVDKRPATLLSGSTQWRLTACLAAAVATSVHSPILLLDGADVLDSHKRRELLTFIGRDLSPNFKHIIVTSTCSDAAKEAEFPPGRGLKKFLLKDGSLAPLLPYVPPQGKSLVPAAAVAVPSLTQAPSVTIEQKAPSPQLTYR